MLCTKRKKAAKRGFFTLPLYYIIDLLYNSTNLKKVGVVCVGYKSGDFSFSAKK